MGCGLAQALIVVAVIVGILAVIGGMFTFDYHFIKEVSAKLRYILLALACLSLCGAVAGIGAAYDQVSTCSWGTR